MKIPAAHPDAVRRSLAIWHDMVERMDMSDLHTIVHEEAVFLSPVAYVKYPGRGAVCLALSTVAQLVKNFHYTRVLASDDGLDSVLEFSTLVNDKEIMGADFIRFNALGMITEFQVMMRPMTGLVEFQKEMTSRIGNKMSAIAKG